MAYQWFNFDIGNFRKNNQQINNTLLAMKYDESMVNQ